MEESRGFTKWKERIARAAEWFSGLFGTSAARRDRKDKVSDRRTAQDMADRGVPRRWRLLEMIVGESTVTARTKSEARAIFKKTLGLKRLPAGSKVVPLGVQVKAEQKAPPPHVKPRHKRNSWRWKFVPFG